jgi:hypothetical protein
VEFENFDTAVDLSANLILRRTALILLGTCFNGSLVFLTPSSKLWLNECLDVRPVGLPIGVFLVNLDQWHPGDAFRIGVNISVVLEDNVLSGNLFQWLGRRGFRWLR